MKGEQRAPRPGEIDSFLAMNSHEVYDRGNNERRFRPSPCCGHDRTDNMSCQINVETGLWKCWVCNKGGNWFWLTVKFGKPLASNDIYLDSNRYEVDRNWIRMFEDEKRRPVTGGHHPEVLDYCHRRGIRNETLDAYRVSTRGPNAVRFPVVSWVDGRWQVVNIKITNCLAEGKTKNLWSVKGGPTGFLIGNHLLDINDPDKRVVITEGQWDAMTAYQLGFRNSFSLPNGSGSLDKAGKVAELLQYIPDDFEVWLAADSDASGDKCAAAFFAKLGIERTARLMLPEKDLNEWLLAKPNLTKADIEAAARGMTSAIRRKSTSGYLKLSLSASSETESARLVSETPYESLNKAFGGGFSPGTTTGLLAPSGRGKTTFSNHIAVKAANEGTTVGLISLEGTRKDLEVKLVKVINSIADKPEETLDRLLVSELSGNQIKKEDLVKAIETLLTDGARLIIIDNLDYASDKDDYKIEVYKKVQDLVKDFDAHAIVVWQPHKIDRDQVVNSGHQKGRSVYFQDSDNYLNLNVFGDYRRIQVEKVRNNPSGEGAEIWLRYDPATNCYCETPAPDPKTLEKLPFSDLRV